MASMAPDALVNFMTHDADFYWALFYGAEAKRRAKEDAYWLEHLADIEDLRDYLSAIEQSLTGKVLENMFLTQKQMDVLGKIRHFRMSAKVLANELKSKGGLSEPRRQLRDSFLADFGSFLKFLATLVKSAPEKFTWQGLKVLNPAGLSDHAVSTSLKFVERAFGILAKRGMTKALQAGLKEIVLVPAHYRQKHAPNVSLSYAGLYHVGKRKITLLVDWSVMQMSSSSLQNFIEVFLHEFGHFVYFEYLTKEARTFFDAGWDIVNQKNEELDLKKRYKNRIEVFELGLDKVRWDYKKYYQTLEGLDKVLFSYMLRELGYVSTPKQLRITEEGKAYATLRNGSYHKDLDTWEGAHNFEQLLQTFGYHVRWMWPDKLWDLYSLKDPVAWANARGGDLIRDWLSHDRGYEDIGDLRDLGWYSKLATTLEGVNLEKIEAFAEINKSLLEDLEKAKDALQIPTQYGRTNVHEDFAETFYIFVLYPKGAALSKEARWRMGRTLGMSASQGRPVIKVARKKLL